MGPAEEAPDGAACYAGTGPQRIRETPRRRSSRWAASRVPTTIAMIEAEKAAAWLVAPRSSSSTEHQQEAHVIV